MKTAWSLRALLVPALAATLATGAGVAGDNPPPRSPDVVRLRSGYRIEGRIVKSTERSLFIDIGHTILELPREVVGAVEAGRAARDAAGGTSRAGSEATEERRDSIFYQREDLEPGPIEEKAREVAESVVRVVCLGKSGSGFVIDDEKGYVVTNYHVIEKERDIAVVVFVREGGALRKVKVEDVRIIAFNPFFDLALLEIPKGKAKLKKAYLGDFSRVGLGDPVFAIGSPLGLERSVSQGIVSNRNRAVSGLVYIQTTAAINPGNSGGALFNNRGEVIGVTNMKITSGESLGFAIPVHHLKDFLRNFQAFLFDKDNPNTGIRYLPPPPKPRGGKPDSDGGAGGTRPAAPGVR